LENKRKQEELAAKAAREQKLEQERQLKEKERLKKEEEKRQKEEERLRKEEKRRLKEEKQRAAEKERKRKEQEAELQRKKKLQEQEQQLVKERKRKAENTNSTTITTTTNIPTLPKKEVHHILADDSNSIITPIGQRRTSVAGPIGSPVKSRSVQQYIANDSDNHHSFFSNFLFGQPINSTQQQQQQQAESFFTHKKANRRVSVDSANLKWSNGKCVCVCVC
jgi:seryl-tRNA synthetase